MEYLSGHSGYLVNASSTDVCEYCEYSTGGEYAKTFNLNENYYGWRGVSLTTGPNQKIIADAILDWHHCPLLYLDIRLCLLDDENSK